MKWNRKTTNVFKNMLFSDAVFLRKVIWNVDPLQVSSSFKYPKNVKCYWKLRILSLKIIFPLKYLVSKYFIFRD